MYKSEKFFRVAGLCWSILKSPLMNEVEVLMARRKRWLSMRKIREIFRLSLSCGMGNREVARSCAISHTVVNKYLKRAKEASLGYREIEAMDEGQLKRLLQDNVKLPVLRPLPDWEWVHRELKRDGVTLQLLWEEYRESNPDGYQPTQFSKYYKLWRGKLELSLRQTHKAGEKMFVDYAGHTVPVIDRLTGEVREAEIFVAVLGASNYTYAEATWDQGLPNWIGSHVRALEYFGGVPKILIPDNLKSGVTKACRYEPDLNPTYHDLALHYGTAIIPARVRRPKDKAKVEVSVQVVERWILAALRNRTFFSLAELNEAIRELLLKLNQRPFKKLKERPQTPARDQVCLCGMEEGQGEYRLSCRAQGPLLQCPLRPCARGGGASLYGGDGGGLLQRQAGRQPPKGRP